MADDPKDQNIADEKQHDQSVTDTQEPVADKQAESEAIGPAADQPEQKSDLVSGALEREKKEEITQEKAKKLGMAYIDLRTVTINKDVLELVDFNAAKKAEVMPFYRLGKKVKVAIAHPTSKETHEIIDQLKEAGYALNFSLSTEEGMHEMLDFLAAENEDTDNAEALKEVEKSAPQKESVATAMSSINRDFKEKQTDKKAEKLGMAYIDLRTISINADVLKTVSLQEAQEAWAIPFFLLGKKLRIALAHPTNKKTRELIEKLKKDGYLLNFNLATEEGIAEAFKYYDQSFVKEKKEIKNEIDEEKLGDYKSEMSELTELASKFEEMTSEEVLNFLNVGAIRTGASDMHIQPEEKHVTVRYRIDGQLRNIFELSTSIYKELSNQIKYQSKLKLNINSVPQDGRYFFVINERKIDVRVSALPTEYGESFVCRFLDSGKSITPIENLGFVDHNFELLKKSLKITEGLILVTGPTGSGKTTTLYSMLNNFNSPENKVITLEDPIEYHIENITQSQINEKRGYTFASGLRAILRQDPDTVMIGEIRDLDTAQAACQAALTGHTVLSTLHTNSAVESIPRLINMGVEPYVIAPALYMVIAQRLVRTVCEGCKEDHEMSDGDRAYIEKTIEEIKKIQPDFEGEIPSSLTKGKGCAACSNTGYKGRTPIVEVLHVDDEIKESILNKAHSHDILEQARAKGMLTMQQDGVKKILQGIVTIEEVSRVTMMKEEIPHDDEDKEEPQTNEEEKKDEPQEDTAS